MRHVITGLDQLAERFPFTKKSRIGLIANETSIDVHGRYSWYWLQQQGFTVQRIFSPEHGLFATAMDQEPVLLQPDVPVEVVSLYGENYDSLLPIDEHLRDVDVIVFDIQDVGSRYYTYLNTMILFLDRLHRKDIPMVVCDRPNPLNGEITEGPLLRRDFRSFVGYLPVPVRHGLTAGETALLARESLGIDCDIHVIDMQHWRRRMWFTDTGLQWVAPSPHMPWPETALVYPGMCLLEGLNVSEGRGTAMPFHLFGAPFINPDECADVLNNRGLPGIRFRPTWFIPQYNKYAGQTIGGCALQVTDRAVFQPFFTGVAITSVLAELYDELEFLSGVYEFNSDHPAFDLLAGGDTIRKTIEAGEDLLALRDSWEKENSRYKEMASRVMIYGN